MSATNRAEASNRNAIIAAILYLALFLALAYGGLAMVRDQPFSDAFLFAFPRALVACALLFLCSAAREFWQAHAKSHVKARHHAIDSLNA